MSPAEVCEVRLSGCTARREGGPRRAIRVAAGAGLFLLLVLLGGCMGGMVGYDEEDDGPAFDYSTGFYEPGGFYYGGWGEGYFGGPPIYGYGRGRDFGHGGHFGNRGNFGHGGHPYRAASPSRGMPSIPRGGGMRGGGVRGGGGHH